MKKLLVISTLVLGITAANAADNSLEFDYINEKVTAYEKKLEQCMASARNKNLPDADALSTLHAYPQPDAEIFLVTRASLAEEECTSVELGELAIAMHLIEAQDIPNPEITSLINEAKPAVFSSNKWELRRHYLSLPLSMRTELESFYAFKQPFNSLLIRDHLFRRNAPGQTNP